MEHGAYICLQSVRDPGARDRRHQRRWDLVPARAEIHNTHPPTRAPTPENRDRASCMELVRGAWCVHLEGAGVQGVAQLQVQARRATLRSSDLETRDIERQEAAGAPRGAGAGAGMHQKERKKDSEASAYRTQTSKASAQGSTARVRGHRQWHRELRSGRAKSAP